ncbi:MAG: hypothetical protein NVV62_15690 [Terricaulis sp.]|nr:hypothetical protein [Terricaulis sp.]
MLIAFAAIAFAWMLRTATVYALPFVAGWSAATFAWNSGAGMEGAAIVGMAAAIGTFACLRFILAAMPVGPMRTPSHSCSSFPR